MSIGLDELREFLKDKVREVGLREYARRLGVDPSNLHKVLSGKGTPGPEILKPLRLRRAAPRYESVGE